VVSKGAAQTGAAAGAPPVMELELRVLSSWDEMERVHGVARDFLSSVRLPEDDVNVFTMVVCELVENAIKYGSHTGGGPGVRARIRIHRGQFSLEVTNPVSERSRVYLRELDRTIQWVRGFQDSYEAYIERMRGISREPLDAERSGLGIVLVSYEGRAALDFFVGEDDMLCVSAVSALDS
jgi:hypothetical protein